MQMKHLFPFNDINSYENGIILLKIQLFTTFNLTIRFVPESPCDFEVKKIQIGAKLHF